MSMYLELVQLNPTINKLCDIVSSAVRANPSSISDEKKEGSPVAEHGRANPAMGCGTRNGHQKKRRAYVAWKKA